MEKDGGASDINIHQPANQFCRIVWPQKGVRLLLHINSLYSSHVTLSANHTRGLNQLAFKWSRMLFCAVPYSSIENRLVASSKVLEGLHKNVISCKGRLQDKILVSRWKCIYEFLRIHWRAVEQIEINAAPVHKLCKQETPSITASIHQTAAELGRRDFGLLSPVLAIIKSGTSDLKLAHNTPKLLVA